MYTLWCVYECMHTITLKIYKVKDEEINLNGQWVQETSWKESYGLGIDSKLKGTRLSIGEHMYSEHRKCKVSKIKKKSSLHTLPCTQSFCSPCWMIFCWTNFQLPDFTMPIQWFDPVIISVWILTFSLLLSKNLWNIKQNPGHFCLHAISFIQGWTLLHHLLFEVFLQGPEFEVVCPESWSQDCSFKCGTRTPKYSWPLTAFFGKSP